MCKRSGLVIACGGGVVTKARNYDLLHQNRHLVFLLLKRPLELLVSDGRPMSITKGIPALARDRGPKDDAWGDIVVSNDAALTDDRRGTCARKAAEVIHFGGENRHYER